MAGHGHGRRYVSVGRQGRGRRAGRSGARRYRGDGGAPRVAGPGRIGVCASDRDQPVALVAATIHNATAAMAVAAPGLAADPAPPRGTFLLVSKPVRPRLRPAGSVRRGASRPILRRLTSARSIGARRPGGSAASGSRPDRSSGRSVPGWFPAHVSQYSMCRAVSFPAAWSAAASSATAARSGQDCRWTRRHHRGQAGPIARGNPGRKPTATRELCVTLTRSAQRQAGEDLADQPSYFACSARSPDTPDSPGWPESARWAETSVAAVAKPAPAVRTRR